MSTFQIPNQGQIRQSNRSDTNGELLETFSIDLNKRFGKIYPSKKLLKILDEDTHFNSSIPVAFEIFDGKYWVLTDDDPYTCSLTQDPTDPSNWSEFTAVTGSLALDSDMVVFEDLLLISNGSSAIYSVNTSGTYSGTWSSGKFTSLTDVGQMHVHKGGQATVFVCNGTTVKSYNSTAGEFTYSLSSDLKSTCIDSGVNAVWVGTESTSGGNAYVYEIYPGEVLNVTDKDGVVVDTVPVPRNAYKVEGTRVMSIEVIDNVPYIVTEKGNIQAFNGAGFSTVASFPFANTTEVISKQAVHPKGMKLHNDSLYINISTERRSSTQNDYVAGCPSGVWEFNRLTGQLHHRFSFSEDDTYYGAIETDRGNNGPIIILDNEYAMLLVGSEVEGDISGVFSDTGSKYGWFKTIEIQSESIQDAYERVYLKAKTMTGDDNITMKYRTVKKDSVFCSGTPITTTRFNTTDDISAVTANADGTYDWVVIDTRGGFIAQVTNISNSTSTYTVTTDSKIGNATYGSRYEFQHWKNITGQYDSSKGEVTSFGDFGTNPWIQFWVLLDGDIELRQFLAKGNSKQEI